MAVHGYRGGLFPATIAKNWQGRTLWISNSEQVGHPFVGRQEGTKSAKIRDAQSLHGRVARPGRVAPEGERVTL